MLIIVEILKKFCLEIKPVRLILLKEIEMSVNKGKFKISKSILTTNIKSNNRVGAIFFLYNTIQNMMKFNPSPRPQPNAQGMAPNQYV